MLDPDIIRHEHRLLSFGGKFNFPYYLRTSPMWYDFHRSCMAVSDYFTVSYGFLSGASISLVPIWEDTWDDACEMCRQFIVTGDIKGEPDYR